MERYGRLAIVETSILALRDRPVTCTVDDPEPPVAARVARPLPQRRDTVEASY